MKVGYVHCTLLRTLATKASFQIMNMEGGKEDIEEKEKCPAQKSDHIMCSEKQISGEAELDIRNSSQ